jgi:uncharacterized protein (TIGR03435 family)
MLTRTLAAILLAAPVYALAQAPAQPAASAASFEVATIKPAPPDAKAARFLTLQGNNRFVVKDYTLKLLLAAAYDLNPRAIAGGPAWAEENHYDITALTPGETKPPRDAQMAMLRTLLAERFQLTFHREPRELSLYSLEVTKGGPKLTASTAPADQTPRLISMVSPGKLTMPASNASMQDFASILQRAILDRPVVEHTNLTGRFDFTLEWAPDETQFNGEIPAASPDAPTPPLFTAIQQQLGLRLVATRGPVDTLVIDHAALPSTD